MKIAFKDRTVLGRHWEGVTLFKGHLHIAPPFYESLSLCARQKEGFWG